MLDSKGRRLEVHAEGQRPGSLIADRYRYAGGSNLQASWNRGLRRLYKLVTLPLAIVSNPADLMKFIPCIEWAHSQTLYCLVCARSFP